MDYYTLINSFGLGLDIIGVIILFKYGLPSDVNRGGAVVKIVSGSQEIPKYKKYLRWAYFGLSLLVLGFVLQLVSNFLK